MAVDSNITITYADLACGGSSDTYQLLGPYVLSKEYGSVRCTFEVQVVGSSYATLQSLSEALEDNFRLRDRDLEIDIDGTSWLYTSGETILNVNSSCTKSGDSDTDVGVTRTYTCEVTGELPSDLPASALRDIEFNVSKDASRRTTLSMQGVYTADADGTASENYLAGADAEQTTFLAAHSGKTFELVDEDYSYDRNDHTCQFSRQLVELLANQSSGTLDNTNIKDHRMSFTDLSQHPGDSKESIYRMRRVVCSYDCAIDIDQYSGSLVSIVENTVVPHVKALFETNFNPQVYSLEDHRYAYDETSKRVSVSAQFVYQKSGGDDVVEVTQTMAYREQRNLDLTPTHNDDEFAAEIDVGWAILDRIATRTVVVIGDETPKRRIGVTPDEGLAGPIEMPGTARPAGKDVNVDGWNIISNTSQTNDRWVGDPNETQVKMTVLTETVVERWHKSPSNRTRSGG